MYNNLNQNKVILAQEPTKYLAIMENGKTIFLVISLSKIFIIIFLIKILDLKYFYGFMYSKIFIIRVEKTFLNYEQKNKLIYKINF